MGLGKYVHFKDWAQLLAQSVDKYYEGENFSQVHLINIDGIPLTIIVGIIPHAQYLSKYLSAHIK